MISSLIFLALAAANNPIFECDFATKRVIVTEESGSLVYRFGTRRKTELELRSTPSSNTIFYHRTLYNRGEDQVLRFIHTDVSYVIFSRWRAPSGNSLETAEGGLLVMKNGQIIRQHKCLKGGDMREYRIFKRLPQDIENLSETENR